MPYSVYFRYNGKKYKLPANPEEIKRSRKLNVEKYQVIGEGQVSVPTHCGLEEISFEAEFPSQGYHYVEAGAKADADHYEKMFRKAQRNMQPVRFIASNGISDDISMMVLIEKAEAVEKAGEEGDKYISLTLLQYKAPGKRYVAVQTPAAVVRQEENAEEAQNPAVTENKTHTVRPGDTLWGLAKKYYGNGALYPKIASANPGIKNPNLIYDGQVLSIPA